MAINSYKQDEAAVKKSKFATIPRLFKYLLRYKGRVLLVLLLMAFGTVIDLINPLIMRLYITLGRTHVLNTSTITQCNT